MGINWRRTSPEQQQQLTEQFRTLLVRTYSSALAAYKNQVIDFKPLRAQAGDNEVRVRSEVKQSGTQPVSIDYSMEKTPNGWKVFDVEVGGVSLVANYRETFASEIRNSGIDGLIKVLVTKNKQLEAKS
jgi:phospholipid transport system substrate-binding protein